MREIFLAAASAAEGILAREDLASAWDRASALEAYTVGGLAGHLARAVMTVPHYLTRHGGAGGRQVDAAGYYAAVLGDHDPVLGDLHQAVRQRAAHEAERGPQDLLDRFIAARMQAEELLVSEDLGRRIEVLDGLTLTVSSYLETRLTELVVHVDDLAVSLDLAAPPPLPQAAYEIVASVLCRLAVRRRGGLPVVRSLARSERHPAAVRAM